VAELKEEQKQQRVIQEAQIKKAEELELKLKQQHDESLVKQAALEKKQDEEIAGIADSLKMLKNQSSSNLSCTPLFLLFKFHFSYLMLLIYLISYTLSLSDTIF